MLIFAIRTPFVVVYQTAVYDSDDSDDSYDVCNTL